MPPDSIHCPYCRQSVPVRHGKLGGHPASPTATYALPLRGGRHLQVNCIGAGETVENVQRLNEAHDRSRDLARRAR